MHRILLSLFLFAVSSLYAQSVIVFESDDVPVAIPDGPNGIANSHMFIEPWYVILDVNVVVTIMHTYDQDLRIYLEAPDEDETVDILAYECGGSGNNYINTRFDDEASVPICSGSPPFSGNFIPYHTQSVFDGLFTHGTWTLRVTDNWNGDTGVIEAWRMEILVDTTAAARPLPVAASFTVGQNYPNPFNPATTLPVQLAKPGKLELTIYNELGRIVSHREYQFSVGAHLLPIDGSSWSSGVYFADVRSGGISQRVSMHLVK